MLFLKFLIVFITTLLTKEGLKFSSEKNIAKLNPKRSSSSNDFKLVMNNSSFLFPFY